MPEAIQKYRLCETCLARQGGRAGDFELGKDKDCFICLGLFSDSAAIARKVSKAAKRYEFKTFSIGLAMPEGVQEREDEVRSAMKMKGRETVKVQLAGVLTELVSAALGRDVDKVNPDLTAVVDFPRSEVRLSSKPMFFYGRYTKPAGIPQRREWCKECRGRGCDRCRQTGFERGPSVEAIVAKKLALSGSDSVRFTWIGSEDKDSRVLPPGRPFVVEVKNPVKRRIPKRFAEKTRRGRVGVSAGRMLPARPTRLPSFRFLTRIDARASGKPGREALRELESRFVDASVQFDRPHNRTAIKKVYHLRVRAIGKALVIQTELDGGLPVKRFVSGELVSPSVSEVLKTEVRCRKFDILRVIETGEFEFA